MARGEMQVSMDAVKAEIGGLRLEILARDELIEALTSENAMLRAQLAPERDGQAQSHEPISLADVRTAKPPPETA